ncbi:MAG: glycosyltransferase family 9 protein [Actinobacteria bacterium]|nr:MAG: glycosyltransferase family 9 protein [Actinomycetota bacterium]
MLGPALREIKRALPESRITLLASPSGSQAAPLLPWVDEVLIERALWQELDAPAEPLPAEEHRLVARLATGRFDAAFIFTSFSQSPHPPAYAAYLAGIGVRVGQSKEFGGGVLTKWVRKLPDETHQADANLHLIEELGFPVLKRDLEVSVDERVRAEMDLMLSANGISPGEPFIAMAPGATCQARRYDINRFAEVARRLARLTGLRLVVLGGPGEVPLARRILDAVPLASAVSLTGVGGVPGLAAVLKRASLLLANDSGPMHLAEAVGCPMVILFSGTELESQWQPRSTPARLMRRETPCAPCYGFRCPRDMNCLDFSPTEVIEEALAMLQRARVHLTGE